MKSKLLYVFSQASANIISALVLIYLSAINEVVGVFEIGVFFSLSAILQNSISFRFEIGVFTDGGQDKERFILAAIYNAVAVTLVLALLVSVAFLIVDELFGLPKIKVLAIIFTCCLASFCLSIKQFYIAKERFSFVSSLNFISILLISTLLVLNFFGYVKENMLFWFLSAFSFPNLLAFLYLIKTERGIFSAIDFTVFLSTLKKGRDFILFSTPGLFINTLAQNLLVLYFASFGEQAEVAQLIIIMKILNGPLSIVAIPISHVISSGVAKLVSKNQKVMPYIGLCVVILAVLAAAFALVFWLLPVSLLNLIGIDENIWFLVFFSLILLSSLRLITSPLSNLINVLKRQKVFFALQMLNLLTVFALLIVGTLDLAEAVQIYVYVSFGTQSFILIALLQICYTRDKSLSITKQ